MKTTTESRMVCHECDLLVRVPALEPGRKAYCPRCDLLLAANRPSAQERTFTFAIAALIFLLLANAFPFLGFSASGQERTITLPQSVAILGVANFPVLASVIFASIIAIPAMVLTGMIYVAIALKRRRLLLGTRTVLRWVLVLLPWSMAEIFLVGILVSFIKIVAIADVSLGLSFWAYVIFSACMIAAVLNLDRRELWQRIGILIDG